MKRFLVPISFMMLLLLPFLVPGHSMATAYLDFSIAGTEQLSWDGNSNDGLVGKVTASSKGASVFAHGSTVSGTESITGAVLNFTTGKFVTPPYPDTTAAWGFAPGGSVKITGSIASLGLSNATLFTATFSGSPVEVEKVENGSSLYSYTTLDSLKLTWVNPALLSHYGFTSGLNTGNLDISLSAFMNATSGKAFSLIGAGGGDVVSNVPVPASVLLLAPGLLSLVGIRKRHLG
jgi:hypothetical protein